MQWYERNSQNDVLRNHLLILDNKVKTLNRWWLEVGDYVMTLDPDTGDPSYGKILHVCPEDIQEPDCAQDVEIDWDEDFPVLDFTMTHYSLDSRLRRLEGKDLVNYVVEKEGRTDNKKEDQVFLKELRDETTKSKIENERLKEKIRDQEKNFQCMTDKVEYLLHKITELESSNQQELAKEIETQYLVPTMNKMSKRERMKAFLRALAGNVGRELLTRFAQSHGLDLLKWMGL